VARIAGVNIPTNKRVLIALQYIHGIGQKNAAEIMEKVKIPDDRRVSQLSDQEVLQIREVIDRDYLVEGDLRRETGMNIKRLMDLGCYRGLRIAADCRCVVSAPIPTRARARARPSPSPARRSKQANSESAAVGSCHSPFATRIFRCSRWHYGGVEIAGKVDHGQGSHTRSSP